VERFLLAFRTIDINTNNRFSSVLIWMSIGSGLPCSITHVVDEATLAEENVTASCHALNGDYRQYNPDAAFAATFAVSVTVQTVKFFLSSLGNSDFHSPLWLLAAFCLDVYLLTVAVLIVPTFCRTECFSPNGDVITLANVTPVGSRAISWTSTGYPNDSPMSSSMNMTSLECGVLTCQRTVHSGTQVNDVVLSWGMLITLWWDVCVHLYVMAKAAAIRRGIWKEDEEETERVKIGWKEEEEERGEGEGEEEGEGLYAVVCGFIGRRITKTVKDFMDFRVPARVLISFFSNIFLGTLTSIAGYVSLIHSADEIRNLIPTNHTDSSQFDGLIAFTEELSQSIRVTAHIAIPLSYSLFLISTCLCILAFHRDAMRVCNDPTLKRLDISYTPLFVGAFISNCLFGLAFHWLIFGLIVFSSQIRTFAHSSSRARPSSCSCPSRRSSRICRE
jgi:hypothetical protein